MRSGEMRERIQLMQPIQVVGKAGSIRHRFEPYLGAIKAQLVHERGGQTIENSEIFADRTLRFNIHKVRETMRVKEGWRVIYDDTPYTIQFVERYDSRQMLQLHCERVNE